MNRKTILTLCAAILILVWSFGGTEGEKSMFRSGLAARAATLNGPTSPYSHVLIVAKSGGDYTTVSDALNSITDNSASSPYLVWIAPGVYTEANGVVMKPYVDIEGAGEGVTKITRAGDTSHRGTLTGASNAEVRYLTVENTGGSSYAIAFVASGTTPRLSHITLKASGGTTASYGMYSDSAADPTTDDINVVVSGARENIGIWYYQCLYPVLTNATITLTGLPGNQRSYAVRTDSSGSLTTNNVTTRITGSAVDTAGIYSVDTSLYIQSSDIETKGGGGINVGISASANSPGTTFTVRVDDSKIKGNSSTITTSVGGTIRVGAAHLSGGALQSSGGSAKCAGVYDENYNFFASTCP